MVALDLKINHINRLKHKIYVNTSKDSEKHLTNTYVSQKLLPNREQKELLNLTKHNKIKTTLNFIFKGKI